MVNYRKIFKGENNTFVECNIKELLYKFIKFNCYPSRSRIKYKYRFERSNNMSVISAKDAAKKWGISQRRVAALCSDGRIPNAQRVGNMWVIPSAAEKPIDGRHLRYTAEKLLPIKPFLKWAGGKGQLLSQIQELYPFGDTKIKRYAEPFIGGGAVLFDILSKYELDEVYISDINAELINTYRAIRDDVDGLINFLKPMEEKFIPIEIEERKE